ncbi:peptidoglycan editing factor PgeF [Salinivibrio sp. ES.052]|uniref:peptidoglycan editing factor PgeF n=1 Tax=Salinivibrio sp. ES.052 TaxID=1882823 RepID=UPI00092658B3|nr:peptidoglycan editing factor PgeF [Salinivibrio sp. ES.052]SIO16546.1 conserved hypothetical protein [Salinivibrio sp. ES.052]
MQYLQPDWPAPDNIQALTTTRTGGVSQGAFAGWNLGMHVGDEPNAVQQNRVTLARQVRGDITWLEQVHGTQVVRLPHYGPNLEADAAFTDVTGHVCTVMTADCLPVLYCSHDGRQVAAAHAGWRGLLHGVLETTLSMFADPSQCLVWLGPAIGPQAFEVGEDVYLAFTSLSPEAKAAFMPKGDHKYLADLYVLATQRLRRAGVTAIYGGEFCTYQQADQFYSYRRDGQTGRMATCIWRAK